MSRSETTPSATEATASASSELPEQVRVRSEKRNRLLESGRDPYPAELPVTSTIAAVREAHDGLEPGEETDDVVGLVGRVMLSRNTGKLCFVTLQDGEGLTLQAMLSAAEVGADSLADYKTDVDLGDILFVHGRVISSRRGELSIMATPGEDTPSWAMAAKAIRPLPKVFQTEEGEGVELAEDTRVRRRYLDLIIRPAARDMVRKRAAVVRSIREYMYQRGFIEIETPMLQTIAGGAAARPFRTHMNAFDTDLFLRIAPELYLKRALVGGVEKVFELNRNFRNEGSDSSHNPEFTMLEAYEAMGTYDTMAVLTRELVQGAARSAFGSEIVTLADGSEYDFSGEWDQIQLYPAASEAIGRTISPETSREDLVRIAEEMGEDIPDHYGKGKIAEVIFEEAVGQHLYRPTFVRDFPQDSSPLTRSHRTEPGLVEKWDLYVRGFELATAYSELTDPVVQRQRFEEQALAAAKGDPEAMTLDEDFLEAMDYGMPPAGGMGMGVDRLLMALTGEGIRETVLFPLVKRL
ncbi:lysine--tRNA ligase [Actinomycetaceae bacterium MB13-C1-2]|nr:lysine--tRNA ligase [Actinomycetaceae bacterium MB13-C1-2]